MVIVNISDWVRVKIRIRVRVSVRVTATVRNRDWTGGIKAIFPCTDKP